MMKKIKPKPIIYDLYECEIFIKEMEVTMENKTRVQLERLLYALVKHDRQAIDDIYEQVEAIDLAEEIEELEDNQLEYLCSHIDDEKLAEILEESEEELQTDIIDYLDNKRVLLFI